MSYKQISFVTTGTHANVLSEYLTALGALAITLKDAGDEPIFEPDDNQPLWQATIVNGLFDGKINHESLLEGLLQAYPLGGMPEYSITELADEDWEKSWMDYYKPLHFGNSLWVVPSWCKVEPSMENHVLLDPGLAFGTGSHETTSLCLHWLAENPPQDIDILDYGCGSGILAIAALKLGAKTALGVDISEQALEASRHNGQLNNILEDKFLLQEKLINNKKYDLVIANILANPLLILAEQLAERCQHKIILSGILEHQVDLIIHKYQTYFKDFQVKIEGEWARVVGTRKCY